MSNNDDKIAKLHKKTGIFSEQQVGSVDAEGVVSEQTGVFSEREVGRFDEVGKFFRKTGLFSEEEEGRVDDDGKIYKKTGILSEEEVGRIDDEGRVFRKTGIWSEEEIGRVEGGQRVWVDLHKSRPDADSRESPGAGATLVGFLIKWFLIITGATIALVFAISAVAASSPVWGGALLLSALFGSIHYHRVKQRIGTEALLKAGQMVKGKKGKERPKIHDEFLSRHLRGFPTAAWLLGPSVLWTVVWLIIIWAGAKGGGDTFWAVLILPVCLGGLWVSLYCARWVFQLWVKSAVKRSVKAAATS